MTWHTKLCDLFLVTTGAATIEETCCSLNPQNTHPEDRKLVKHLLKLPRKIKRPKLWDPTENTLSNSVE